MNLIDTHAHLTFDPLAGDIDGVLQRSRAAGVTEWITVGTDPEDNQNVLELIDRHEGLYGAAGLHPHIANAVKLPHIRALQKMTDDLRIVAVGETGLDFHYNFSKQNDQKRLFVEHLNLARAANRPVIVHSRNAFEETVDILETHGQGLKVVFHCFGGTAEQARKVLEHKWFISFTGVVTFKNAHIAREAVLAVPLDRLMLETDCPYMSPEPMRKQKTNEPALMVHTAQFLAELKQVPFDAFAESVTRTSRDFFRLPAV